MDVEHKALFLSAVASSIASDFLNKHASNASHFGNYLHLLISKCMIYCLLDFFPPVVSRFNDISMKSVSILYGECNIKKHAGNVIISIMKPLLD
jgi:hypothetical protein